MKNIIGGAIILIGWIGGIYVGGWLLFIQPILAACRAFDMGTLTATLVGITVLKCLSAGLVGGLIAWIGSAVGGIVLKI